MVITIKKIEKIEDFHKILELDLKVWGGEPIPVHQTLTAAKNGGIVLGAFEDEKLVGFLYSFAGFQDGEVHLCSHMMGIDPDYQNQGIGSRLKLAQAEEALKLGYKKIRWTYDPLESRNGYLNIAKLGAICSDYVENCYGDMQDGLNRNMPTDRFHVEWLIDDPHSVKRQELMGQVAVMADGLVLDWHMREDGLPEVLIRDENISSEAPFLFVPVPVTFQEMKEKDPELALDWRWKTRAVFQQLFTDGWAVVHVIREQEELCQYYVLCKRSDLNLSNGGGSE